MPTDFSTLLRRAGLAAYTTSSANLLHPKAYYPEKGIGVGYGLALWIIGSKHQPALFQELCFEYNWLLSTASQTDDGTLGIDYADWIERMGQSGVEDAAMLLPNHVLKFPVGKDDADNYEQKLYLHGIGYVYSKARRILIEKKMYDSSLVEDASELSLRADLAQLAVEGLRLTTQDFGSDGES